MEFVKTFIYDPGEYTTREEALEAFDSQINNFINENGKYRVHVKNMAIYGGGGPDYTWHATITFTKDPITIIKKYTISSVIRGEADNKIDDLILSLKKEGLHPHETLIKYCLPGQYYDMKVESDMTHNTICDVIVRLSIDSYD